MTRVPIVLKKFYIISALFILDKILDFFGVADSGYSALYILKQVVYREFKSIKSYPAPIEKQVFFLFANRMIVDAQSSRILAKKGLYGSGYSLTAVMLRSITMYASLMADRSRLESFWNEEENTYQMDHKFSSSFKESSIRYLAKSKFDRDAFDRSEIEKLLHGSCYAIRKYYSKKIVDPHGKSKPLLVFGKFKQNSKEDGLKSISGAIILDFLGIFFTEYQESSRNNYEDLLVYYHTVIRRVQIETARIEKENVTKQPECSK